MNNLAELRSRTDGGTNDTLLTRGEVADDND
jgi:hypothetical protein